MYMAQIPVFFPMWVSVSREGVLLSILSDSFCINGIHIPMTSFFNNKRRDIFCDGSVWIFKLS